MAVADPTRRPGTGSSPTPLATARHVLETMRPRQWIKNTFVFGGLLYSGEVVDVGAAATALAVFAAFCLASGATYLLNDAADMEADRLNPRTAGRPIARGDLRPRTAVWCAVLAGVVALGVTALVGWETLATLAAFLVLQLAYSLWLKRQLFVDVLAVAAGFVLRAFAGLVCIDVVISEWLLLCTGLLALFLALGKRRGEAVALGGTAHPQRPVLEEYSVGLIDELIAVVTPSIIVAYSAYGVLGARSQLMLLTVPFVIYGVFRVLYLLHHRSELSEDPTLVVWRDRPLQVCIALWGLSAGVISVLS